MHTHPRYDVSKIDVSHCDAVDDVMPSGYKFEKTWTWYIVVNPGLYSWDNSAKITIPTNRMACIYSGIHVIEEEISDPVTLSQSCLEFD